MKRKIIIGGSVIAVLLGSVLIAPSFINWNSYKGQILSQLHNATGHDYDIGGPLKLSLLPFPHVSIDSLTVKAPKEQGGASLLQLDKAEVSVALLPLLSGQVNIRSITLDKPVFNIGIQKDGTPTWMTEKLKPRADAAISAPNTGSTPGNSSIADKVVLQSINIHNGSFRFSDARNGSLYTVQDINLKIKADSLFGPYALSGDLVYNNAKIDVDAKSGAVGKNADTVAVEIKAGIAAAHATAQFSGVTNIKAPYQIQGQADIVADNMSAALAPFVKKPPAGLDKAARIQGVLKASANAVSFRNARLSFGAAELGGDIAVDGLKQSPINVNVALSSNKPVNIDNIIPQSSVRTSTKPSQETAPVLTHKNMAFLPETLVLPASFAGKISIHAPSVIFKSQPFNDAVLEATIGTKNIAGQFKSSVPGTGMMAGNFNLAYTSAGQVPSGGFVLVGAALSYDVRLKTEQPKILLQSFVAANQLKKLDAALIDPLSFTAKGEITGHAIKVDTGSLVIMNNPFAFSGSYSLNVNNGRDLLGGTIGSDYLDVDKLLQQRVPTQQAAAPSAPAKVQQKDVMAPLQSLNLPFDLNLGASFKILHYGGNEYANANANGRLSGNRLTITNAGFQDDSGNVLNVAGSIGDIHSLTDIDATLKGRTPNADLLMKTLKLNNAGLPANVGAADASINAKGSSDHLGFTANVKALRGTVEASGTVENILQKPAFSDLTLRVQHPNYEDLMKLYNPSFHASVDIAKNLDFFTTVQHDGNIYSFKEFRATIGPATVNGDIKIDMGGTVPFIASSLQFTNLPLDKLLGAQASSGQAAATGNGKTETIRATMNRNSGSGEHWSRELIATDWMHKWNADIKTTAGNASYGTWQFSNAAMDFTLKDGTLTLSKLDGGLYGGHISMSAKMASQAQAQQPLDAGMHVSMENVSLQSFVQSFSGSHLVKAQGSINLVSDINTRGVSPAALISDLAGKGTVKGSNIRFDGFDLARISRALSQPSSNLGKSFSSLLGAATEGGSTQFQSLDGAFTVAEGVINFDKMHLAGTDANVDTAGTVNLPLWIVNLTNTITLAEPKANPPPPLKIAFQGPLDNPAQTFGKGPLENYFMQQYGGKLQDKLGKLDKSGALQKSGLGSVLGGVLGVPQNAPATPAAGSGIPNTTVAPATAGTQNAAPSVTTIPSAATGNNDAIPLTAAPTPAVPAAAPPKKVKTKDLLKGLLQNIQQGSQQ